jgi:hypothetical protein
MWPGDGLILDSKKICSYYSKIAYLLCTVGNEFVQ